MKVHSNFAGQPSKKRLLAFSCATALASFAIIARPAFAEEAKADSSPNLDTTADDLIHVDKTKFDVPFVCGAKDLGEALRRISEGASMIRTKGEPGTGDIVQAVHHLRLMNQEIRRIQNLRDDELYITAKDLQVPIDLVRYVHEHGKLPVVNFAAGGVATPADAALMMQLGAEGVFVGSGIFKSGDPKKRAEAIVKAVTNFDRPDILAQVSEDLGEAMVGINKDEIEILMAERGK